MFKPPDEASSPLIWRSLICTGYTVHKSVRGLQYSKLDGNQIVIGRYWQKYKILLFANAWKCLLFERLRFKFGLNSNITWTNFLQKYNMGIKQSRFLRWCQICLLKFEQNHPKKVEDKRSLKKAWIVKNSKFVNLFRYNFFFKHSFKV